MFEAITQLKFYRCFYHYLFLVPSTRCLFYVLHFSAISLFFRQLGSDTASAKLAGDNIWLETIKQERELVARISTSTYTMYKLVR